MALDAIAPAPLSTKSARADWLVPLGLVALGLIPALGGAARLASFVDARAAQVDGARFASHPAVLAAHVVAGLTFSLLGALQFSPGLRRRRTALHRAAGRLLAPAAIAAALSGFATMWIFPAAPTSGTLLHAMRIASGLALIGSVVLGLAALQRRDYPSHGAWMTRAYAVGIAPGTQALVLAPLCFVLRVDTVASYTAGMALGWIVNAVVAEKVIAGRARARLAAARTMNAIVYDRYGSPDELRLARVAKPAPKAGQVLVRVEATSLNSLDRRMLRADPFLVRLANGLRRPRARVLGADFAGSIVAVGPGVHDRTVGDRVFGDCSHEGLGAFAEYVCVRARSVAGIPEGMSALSAASLPLAAVTALQCVRERARVRPGQRVLVWGAGGGVGAHIVQIAKAYGAEVTAVAGPRSVEKLRALGADRVLDYAALAPIEPGSFDAVIGVNGYQALRVHLARVVRAGVYVMVGGDSRQLFEALLFGAIRARLAGRRAEVLTLDAALLPHDLEELRSLVARGALHPVVDRVVPLADVAEALRAIERGECGGKTVLDASAFASSTVVAAR